MIHQDVDPEPRKAPDPERDRQREGTQDVKPEGDPLEDVRRTLRDLFQRYPELFKDIPGGCTS